MPSLHGTAGTTAGRARGEAVVAYPDHVPGTPGEPYVLVAPSLGPELSALAGGAVAVVLDQSAPRGLPSTAGLSVPIVGDCGHAVDRIAPGDTVDVDAARGVVSWVSPPDTCPFCRKPPEAWLAASRSWMVVRDGFPVRRGHLLVVSRRHVGRLAELDRDARAELIDVVVEAQALLAAENGASASNVGLNDGEAAGQTVGHVHVHVIPRIPGDTPSPRGGVRNLLPDPVVAY